MNADQNAASAGAEFGDDADEAFFDVPPDAPADDAGARQDPASQQPANRADAGQPDRATNQSAEAEIPLEQLREAIFSGISVEDARALGPVELEKLLGGMRQPEAGQPEGGQQAGQQRQPQGQGQSQPQEEAQPDPWAKFDTKLDPDLYDPEVIAAVEGLNAHHHRQVSELRGIVSILLESHQQAESAKFTAEMESFFGTADAGLFGKGELAAISAAAQANRHKVVEAMGQLYATEAGRSLPRAELAKRAMFAAFGDQLLGSANANARKQITQQLRDDAGRFSGRPSASRDKHESDPEKRALATVAAHLDEWALD